MIRIMTVTLLLLAGCGFNPKPRPPAPCPEECPLGTACTDPAKGCEPIPAPGPTCAEGQSYDCWHWPPDSRTWLYACPVYNPDGEVIGVVNVVSGPAQCPAKPPKPPTCPTCPAGYSCTDPAVGCIKDPEPPPVGSCPWSMPAGTRLGANTKYYGQGLDHTTLVIGSSEYCAQRGWTDGRSTCQVAIDGDPNKVACEIAFGGGCPRFEFRANGVQRPCVNDQNDFMSCDHFGDTVTRDDPQTPDVFEGEPKECAKQKGPHGYEAGFFAIAHGLGEVRSCVDSTFSACGPWLAVNH